MKNIKIILLLVFGLMAMTSVGQTIFTNPITGTNPNTSNPYTIGQIVNSNITVSGIGRGLGITGTGANDRYNANDWSTTVLDVNDYFEFILTPNTGFKIDFTSFVYIGQASGTGPTLFAFRSSTDGHVANIGTPTVLGTTIDLSGISFQNITTPITFRLYGFGANAAGGTFSVNDFEFNGTVTAIGKTSVASGDWNAAGTWSPSGVPAPTDNVTILNNHVVTVTNGFPVTRDAGTTTIVNTGGTLAVSDTYTNNGATTINGSFQLNASGAAAGTTDFVYGSNATTSTLIFNTAYTANTTQYWPATSGPVNVTVNSGAPLTVSLVRTVPGTFQTASGVTLGAALTLNGIARINTNGFFSNAPIYGSTSTLIYNTGAAFNRGNEWTTATSGAGYPANVQVSNFGTTVNMGATSAQCSGSLSIDNATVFNSTSAGLTALGNVTTNGTLFLGGDITVQGNWTVGASAIQLNNGKAVFFTAASGNQTITKTATGVVFFDFLVINKAAGNVVLSASPATSVTINTATAGAGVVQLVNAGTLDLNGQTFTLNNSFGDIIVNASGRTITSSVAGATLAITGNKFVTGAGTLIIGSNVTTVLSAGFDFGINKTTINGILQINPSGFVLNATAPIYASGSTLRFNTGGNFDMHDGTVEVVGWFRNVPSTGVAQGGIPWNVQISGNTSLRYNAANNDVFPRYINGNLTIDSGSSFTLGGFGATAGDFYLRGNWNRAGTFTPNNRLVAFNGTAAQTITGATTFDYLTINNAAGVTLNNSIVNNLTLDLLNGKVTLGANDVTIGSGGTITNFSTSKYFVTNGIGQLKRTVGATDVLFAVGGTSYNPITFNNAGTQDIYGIREVDGAVSTALLPLKTVSRSWIVSEGVAGGSDLKVVAQYNTGDENTQFNAGTTPKIGFYNGATWTEVVATQAGANPFTFTSNTNFVNPSINGTNYFAIGKDNAFFATATQYVVTAVTPNPAGQGYPVSITVQAQDAFGLPTNVTANSTFTLSTNEAAGTIGGTVTGTIVSGTNSIIVSGVIFNGSGTGVTVTATNSSGLVLSPGTSATFTVLAKATKLGFGTTPPATGIVNTNLTSFTVRALRPDDTVDTFYTGTITIAKASGSGVLSGTLTASAVAGIATFSTYQFNAVDTYTIVASATGLTSVTSGNIVISPDPALGYFRSNVTSGSWSIAASWQTSNDGSTGWITATVVPTNTSAGISIQSGHTIISSTNISADDITINAGGTLTISAGTFTLNNGAAAIDLQVNGTLTYSSGTFTTTGSGIAFGAASTYNHSIASSTTLTLPIATWNATSTCNVTGMTNTGPISGGTSIGQSFGNFNWNNALQGSFFNIENSAFRVNGTLTVGPTTNIDNKLSFSNSAGTYSNTVNTIVVTGGQLNGVGNSAVVNLIVTTSISISGGILAVSDGSGTANISVGTDVNLSGTGKLYVLNKGTSPTQTLNITNDLNIIGTGYLDMETVSSTGLAIINIGRDFICTATFNPTIDFGTGSVTGNIINITRNFNKSGTGQFQTTSGSQATGFSFVGNGTFSYSGTNSNWTSYIVQNGATLQLNSNLTLGINTNPPSYFTVAGTLNLGTNSIIAGNTTEPRFITTAGATLITSNTNGLGGTTATGSVQSFGSVNSTTAAGRATFVNGTNYTFNGNTTTPFPNGTIGSAATININANVTSNYAATLAVTAAFNVNGTNVFRQNPANNNNIALSGIMTIASGATFDNNGTNQITLSGTPSIVVNGTFITRAANGFVGSNTSIPSITPVLNPGSTVEYGLAGNQTVQGGTAPTYQNITFSNGGIKTLVSANEVVGTISVLGTTIFDAGNSTFGSGSSTITMTGTSVYKLGGSGVKPDSGGTYTLGNASTFEFIGTSATQIRVAPSYANVLISGTNIKAGSTDDAGLTFQNPGTFKVTNTGVFKVTNTTGFTGSTTSAIKNTSNPTITLDAGSTVEYSRAGDQTITLFSPFYRNLTISGTGTKTLQNTTQTFVNENLSLTASKLLLNAGEVITVRQAVNSVGELELKNSAQLIQIDENVANTGTNVKVERIATVAANDYVFWSSPLAGFDIAGIPDNNPYFWNPQIGNANSTVGNWSVASGSMQRATGYIVRSSTSPSITTTFSNGTPFNGSFPKTIFRGNYDGSNPLFNKEDDNWNLIGNPYPSAISADKFLIKNATGGSPKIEYAVWVWKHAIQPANIVSPYYANFASNYSTTDYIKFNEMGSTPPNMFNGFIASGQGFMVNMLHSAGTLSSSIVGTFITNDFYSADVTFENNMRYTNTTFVPYSNTQFLRPSADNSTTAQTAEVEKHRIWLNIANGSNNQVDTMLLGYATNATLGRDRMYDCFYGIGSELGLYSLINQESFIIQGRPLPFDANDQVPLGMKIATSGTHTIAIHQVDGLFSQGQGIYLQDNVLNIIHDLRQAPYSFSSNAGNFTDRFVLRYTTTALGNSDFSALDNSVFVSGNQGILNVKSSLEVLKSVQVFDILGRQILDESSLSGFNYTNALLPKTNQTLIVKVLLANGFRVTKKIVF